VKILITGSTGLLGQSLSRRLAAAAEVVGLSRHAPDSAGAGAHQTCDLRDARRTAEVVHAVGPDVVIHAQAQSDVDRCEVDPAGAFAENVETTAHLLAALHDAPARLVYVSTDYVFDGAKGAPYDEDDAPSPLGVYGRTKREAETLVLARSQGVVIRVSTLFGPGRPSYCERVVTQLRAGAEVEAFTDQTTSPTYTEDVAEALADLLPVLTGRAPTRVLHVTNAGGCTRLVFARRIAELLGLPASGIRPVRMADQRRPAPRPAYSALATRHLPQLIGRTLQPWDDALQAHLRERRWIN
jgi:dTDP-4-dehydrorhamnose reductase